MLCIFVCSVALALFLLPAFYIAMHLIGSYQLRHNHPYNDLKHPEMGDPDAVRPSDEEVDRSIDERELVEEAIVRLAGIEHAIVDVETNALVVYLPGVDDSSLERLRRGLAVPAWEMKRLRDLVIRTSRYYKAKRFFLVDADERLFVSGIWHFESWLDTGEPEPLATAVEQFVRRLARKSPFEVM